MNRLLQHVLVFACLGVSASTATAERRWSVRAGDTLTSIARQFSVTVQDTIERNRLKGDRLRIGQTLRIGPATRRSGAKPKPAEPDRAYRVQRGDTLGAIAEKLGTSVSELLAKNSNLNPDRIREGQRLRLGDAGHRVRYRVRRGDTVTRITRRFRVAAEQLRRWNPGLSAKGLRANQTLVLYTAAPSSNSQSVGTPNAGKLLHARALRPHRAYRIRDRKRSWGTAEVVHHIRTAFDRLLARFPGTPAVEVHDLSYRKGGPISHHRSHQSGRDVDIAYFQKACARRGCDFRPVSARSMDVRRQWALLEQWLKRDLAEAVFIDYSLQKALYNRARRRGATSAQLQRWFQYPRGRGFPLGVIRHFPKHGDHMHVRFACHKTDKRCRTFRPLLTRARHASR